MESLDSIAEKTGIISEVKGKGLMIGVKLNVEDATPVFEGCMKEGLLINCTQGNILRIMPPVTVTKDEIDEAMVKLSNVLEKI